MRLIGTVIDFGKVAAVARLHYVYIIVSTYLYVLFHSGPALFKIVESQLAMSKKSKDDALATQWRRVSNN